MITPLTEEAAALIATRFRALADPTRLRILDFLRRHPDASVRELTEAVGSSQQNVSKHLGALLAEGFVSRRKEGTSSRYRIADDSVMELCERVCDGIEARLAALGAMFESR